MALPFDATPSFSSALTVRFSTISEVGHNDVSVVIEAETGVYRGLAAMRMTARMAGLFAIGVPEIAELVAAGAAESFDRALMQRAASALRYVHSSPEAAFGAWLLAGALHHILLDAWDNADKILAAVAEQVHDSDAGLAMLRAGASPLRAEAIRDLLGA